MLSISRYSEVAEVELLTISVFRTELIVSADIGQALPQ